MPNHTWLEHFQTELTRQGLPHRERARLMDELRDHIWDLEQESSMDAHGTQTLERRVGKPEVIAEQAVVEYRKRSIIARHPLIAFTIAPLPLLVLTTALALLLTVGIAACLRPLFADMPYLTTANVTPLGILAMNAGLYAWYLAPFALAAAVTGWVARRYQAPRASRIIAFALLAVATALAQTRLVLPVAPQTGKFSLGFSFPIGGQSLLPAAPEAIQLTTGNSVIAQILLALLPICIGYLMLRRGRARVSV